MIFDSRCAGCDRVGPVLCRACRFALAAPVALPRSGDVIAALPFAGRPRHVILGFKYGNRRQLGHHIAGLLVNRLLAAGVRPHDVDVVTWAPTSRARRRRRGFDQAELVARRVAAQLGVPCRRLLEREGGDVPQTGRDRAARLHGPVFRTSPRAAGERVLVVDDVVTTGATLRSAADALRRAGARSVVRAALATTPAAVAKCGDRPLRTRQRPTAARADRRPTVVQGPRAA
jgi:ComF family protein